MTTYTIRLVHDRETRRLRFRGPEESKPLVHTLNERLDQVSALPLDEMVNWTIEEMRRSGCDLLDPLAV